MTDAPHSPLVERVGQAILDTMFWDHGVLKIDPDKAAQAALAACHAEEMLEVLRWYASEEAYRTEGKPDDTVYDRMHRRERVLLDRGERASALLAKLDGRS